MRREPRNDREVEAAGSFTFAPPRAPVVRPPARRWRRVIFTALLYLVIAGALVILWRP